jgi:hypothetical protein
MRITNKAAPNTTAFITTPFNPDSRTCAKPPARHVVSKNKCGRPTCQRRRRGNGREVVGESLMVVVPADLAAEGGAA